MDQVEKARKKYIDLTKGFAIVMMIFGHTMYEINAVHRWIYSFHMPIFFIICGILMWEKNTVSGNVWTRKKFTKRLYAVWVPYFCFGTMMAVFYSMLNIMAQEPNSFAKNMLKLFTLKGIDSLWFLPVYFFAELLMRTKKHRILSAGCFVWVFLTEFCSWGANELLYKIALGICFVEIGILIAKYQLAEKVSNWMVGSFVLTSALLAQVNGAVEMGVHHIGNPVLYFICATIMSVAVLGLFQRLEDRASKCLKILEIYGKNSMVLLCTNNILIEIIRLLDYKIANNALISIGMLGCIIFTLLLLLIEWYIIKLANGKFAFWFGKSN